MRLPVYIASLLLAGLAVHGVADELKPFTTDGCTFWPEGPPGRPNLWRHCCVAHDLAYWQGGSQTQRLAADQALKSCLRDAHSALVASHVYWNVRIGGAAYWPTGFRWGYGWSYWQDGWWRGYALPTPEQQVQISQLLPDALRLVEEDARLNPPPMAGDE